MGSIDRQPPLLSEDLGTPLPLPRPTAYDLISSSHLTYPTRTALVCMHQPSSLLSDISQAPTSLPYLSWTFAQLKHASHVLACSLASAGIKPGDMVATFVHNCAEFHVLLWASLELNCVFAPIQARVAGNREEVEHILDMITPSVILAQETDIIEKLTTASPKHMTAALKLFSPSSSSDLTPEGWTSFSSFVSSGLSPTAESTLSSMNIERKHDDVILVMTTSGTTSLPKCCVHTSKSLTSGIRGWMSHARFGLDDASLVHMPLSHIMGFVFAFVFHASGLKAVHPSPLFSPGASLAAIKLEKATYVPGVPAMVHAMLSHPDFKKEDMGSLRYTMLAATTILPETLRMVLTDLGSEKAFSAFGMTETGPACIPRNTSSLTTIPDKITCGTILDGAKLRVCKPGSLELVERGLPGECHIGGDGVIKEYWLGKGKKGKSDAFYTDEHGTWIRTGDQAVMHENGEFEIVGRYKDMIVRGGENISPMAIEALLFSRFALIAEVIGVPDEIAGEIPLAIIKPRPGQEVDAFKVRELLVKELGAAWVPEEIIDVGTFGIEDFPRTPSGKVQKNVLRNIVMESRPRVVPTTNGDKTNEMLNKLIQLWTDLLKVSPGTLTASTSVRDWADSLILARFSGILHRQTGLLMNIQELTENPTIAAQATLLSARSAASSSTETLLDMAPAHEGPPKMEDIVHTLDDPDRFDQTKKMAEDTLAPLGLSWEDVEDIIPMNPYQKAYIQYRRPQTYNHRHAFLCPGSSITQVRTALESALKHHSILRTMAFYFDDETPLHITVRPSNKWYESCITVVPNIKTCAELSTLVYNDPKLDFACFPGPMFRMVLTHVEDSNCAGLVYQAQHSVFDGISLTIFLDDLDALLKNPKEDIKPHIPFKAWADNYYTMQDSALAKASVRWQANRLKGIASNPGVLFPVQRAPEWFKGNSAGWIDLATGQLGPVRMPLDTDPIGVKGIKSCGQLPDIQTLKIKHNIEASQIVKAAFAVLTSRYTKQDFALFGQSQAGRTWPFLPDWQVARMPPAMAVNGPCTQGNLNRIAVDNDETVLSMLTRLQNEQHLLNKHAYAPNGPLTDALNKTGNGDGEFMNDASRRQVFNWLPTEPEFKYEMLKVEQIESRTDCGLLWNCVMVDRTTVQIHPTWDDAQLRRTEVQEMLDELLRISEAFAREENWGRRIGEVL